MSAGPQRRLFCIRVHPHANGHGFGGVSGESGSDDRRAVSMYTMGVSQIVAVFAPEPVQA